MNQHHRPPARTPAALFGSGRCCHRDGTEQSTFERRSGVRRISDAVGRLRSRQAALLRGTTGRRPGASRAGAPGALVVLYEISSLYLTNPEAGTQQTIQAQRLLSGSSRLSASLVSLSRASRY